MRSRQIAPTNPSYTRKIIRFDPQYIHAPCFIDYTVTNSGSVYSADMALGEAVSSSLVQTWRTISA